MSENTIAAALRRMGYEKEQMSIVVPNWSGSARP